MDNAKIFKQITPTMCPHCKKEILVGTQAMMPSVTSVSTLDQIKEIKEKIKVRLEDIIFSSDDDKQQVLAYLENDNTFLDNSDIESIIKQISVEQAEKISQTK